MLFAFIAYKEQFAQRVSALIDKVVELQACCACRASGWPTSCSTAPEPQRRRRAARRGDRAAALELRGVSFRYSDAEPLVLAA